MLTESPTGAPTVRERGWAVVTGASSGIGQAFARALARRGYPVLAVARRRDRLEELQRELASGGARVELLAQDLIAPGAGAAVEAALAALGPPELLINNAGYGSHGPFLEQRRERELEMVQLNVAVLVELSHRLAPAMVARRRGGIINIASIGAFQPVPWMATYGASKSFVLSFSEALAHELQPHGVRVLCICPGPTQSEFFAVAELPPALRKVPHLMSADRLVARALAAYEGGRVVKVPGLINFLGAFFTRFTPRPWLRWITGTMFKPPTHKALPPPPPAL